eukprot:scaffold671920_cov53-Prasinocladus_malaysianus.AAC.2
MGMRWPPRATRSKSLSTPQRMQFAGRFRSRSACLPQLAWQSNQTNPPHDNPRSLAFALCLGLRAWCFADGPPVCAMGT